MFMQSAVYCAGQWAGGCLCLQTDRALSNSDQTCCRQDEGPQFKYVQKNVQEVKSDEGHDNFVPN